MAKHINQVGMIAEAEHAEFFFFLSSKALFNLFMTICNFHL